MARGPRLTEADHAAWAGITQHIAPLTGRAPPSTPPDAAAAPKSTPSPPPHRSETRIPSRGAPPTPLAIGGPPGGVDKATWQRFRSGKLQVERRLDLHGMTAQRAYQALASFLRAAHAERIRCVEIVTGRGTHSGTHSGDTRGEPTGVLRRELPHWLNRPDLRPLVLAAAHPHAANQGAVRLLLRRVR
jgi:DNA-nicking Smr family endonuclease